MSFVDPKGSDRWDRGIDFLQRAGDHAHVPLLEATRDGILDLVYTSNRTGALPIGRIRNAQRPVLVLVGDDDDTPTGPEGWLPARQLTRWCAGAIIHGAGAERRHYETAVLGALACRKFLMVDTASRFVPTWMAMLGHVQALAIMPREGAHPLPMQAETMH